MILHNFTIQIYNTQKKTVDIESVAHFHHYSALVMKEKALLLDAAINTEKTYHFTCSQ